MRILNKSTQNKHSAGMSALGQAPSVRSKMPHSREKSGILDSRANSSTFISFHKKNAQGKSFKKGFTLMELMVYCGLIGIIVMVAGQAYSDSVKFRVRSEAMVKSSSEANAAAVLLQEDLSQMGAKASFEDGSAYQYNFAVLNDTSTGSDGSITDKASYDLVKNYGGSGLDSISFKRVVYDDEGKADFVQRIAWVAKDKKLFRECETVEELSDKTAPADCKKYDSESPEQILMASNSVTKFSLTPGKRLQDGKNCPTTNESRGCLKSGTTFTLASRGDGSGEISPLNVRGDTISGFFNNNNTGTSFGNHYSQLYFLKNEVANPEWDKCTLFTFEPNMTYAVSFYIYAPSRIGYVNYMRNFQAEQDHIGVGFRGRDGNRVSGAVDDFLVYPSQQDDSKDGYRYFEFSFREQTQACLTFTFSFYSSHAAEGYLVLSGIGIYPRDEASYDFTPGASKDQHKAFKLDLDINNRGEITEIKRLIPTPNNGV